jgi:hypothetical protein
MRGKLLRITVAVNKQRAVNNMFSKGNVRQAISLVVEEP